MLRRIIQLLDLCGAQLAHATCGITQPQLACADNLSRRNQRTGPDHGMPADARAIEHRRVHADQAGILDRAGVQDGAMTDSHISANQQWKSTWCVRTIVADMQHRAILDIRACANANEIDVAARHCARPQGSVVAELDVADNNSGGIDVDVGAKAWQSITVRTDIHSAKW